MNQSTGTGGLIDENQPLESGDDMEGGLINRAIGVETLPSLSAPFVNKASVFIIT